MKLIDLLITEIAEKTQNYIPLIIDQNARVENYFSVITIGLLDKLKSEKVINKYEFQYHVKTQRRKHIDFLITDNNKNYLIELKHLAIDNIKKNSTKRNLKFYTNSSNSKNVGLIGDIEKLENLNDQKNFEYISLAIITNPPSNKEISNKLYELKSKYVNWEFNFLERNEYNLGFIISKKK